MPAHLILSIFVELKHSGTGAARTRRRGAGKAAAARPGVTGAPGCVAGSGAPLPRVQEILDGQQDDHGDDENQDPAPPPGAPPAAQPILSHLHVAVRRRGFLTMPANYGADGEEDDYQSDRCRTHLPVPPAPLTCPDHV